MPEVKFTERGFGITEFTDRYGAKCSLQKSSLATENCIWFGVDSPETKTLIPGKGWTDVDVDAVAKEMGGDECSINGRMHLTQDQVIELLPILQRFAETGEIGQ